MKISKQISTELLIKRDKYMKPYLILIFVFSFCTGCESDNKIEKVLTEQDKIVRAINDELMIYPEERLIDLYKSFFQGYWGPGHLIADSISALNYINSEIEGAEKYHKNLSQPLGHYGKYFRVNLKLVAEGKIPKEKYLSAFIQSANDPDKPSLEEWIVEWNKVIAVIEEGNFGINSFEKDKKIISQLLDDGKYVVHHSAEFVELYNPHYRVIDKEYFDKLMVNFIKQRVLSRKGD